MARALLDRPLPVLLAQAEYTQGQLRTMPSVREAMTELGIDVPSLDAELEAAVTAATTAVHDTAATRLERERVRDQRAALLQRVDKWARDVRKRAALAVMLDPDTRAAVRAIKRRLGYDQRRFKRACGGLRSALPHLHAANGAFGDLVETAEALHVEVQRVEGEDAAVKERLRAVDAQSAEARDQLMTALRRVRIAWDAAEGGSTLQRPVPPMSLSVLRSWASPPVGDSPES